MVHDGRIVGEGWHVRAGEAHAEVVALGAANSQARGATVYVTPRAVRVIPDELPRVPMP